MIVLEILAGLFAAGVILGMQKRPGLIYRVQFIDWVLLPVGLVLVLVHLGIRLGEWRKV